jgi:hypothetical protein
MLLYIPNEKHEHLLFFDTEFDNQRLVQVSIIHYQRIIIEGVATYLLEGSINVYINRDVSEFFINHTGITPEYLSKEGVKQKDAVDVVNKFLWALNNKQTLLISHGVNQDAIILAAAGIKIDYMERYCTHNNAKRILKRDKCLKLIDICDESGYFTDQHDAYTDAKNTVHAFSYLKLVEHLKEIPK